MKLTSEQKKFLKGLAHSVDAQVFFGKSGITEELVQELDRSLESHELVKMKFNQGKEEKKELALELAEKTHAVLVEMVGNNAIIFREQKVTEKRKIKLPR